MPDENLLDGYLDIDLPIAVELSQKFRSQFAVAHRVNRECHRLLFDLQLSTIEGRKLAVAILFARTLQHYQAAVILLSKGMVAAASAAIRAQIESVFALRAVAANKENFEAYVKSDLVRRKDIAIDSRKYPDYAALSATREAITDEALDALEKEIIDRNAKKITTADLSKMAGMHDVYKGHYRILSSAIHTSPKEMDSHLVLDADENIAEITYHPHTEETPSLLMAAADYLLAGASAAADAFEAAGFSPVRAELADLIERNFPDFGKSD